MHVSMLRYIFHDPNKMELWTMYDQLCSFLYRDYYSGRAFLHQLEKREKRRTFAPQADKK